MRQIVSSSLALPRCKKSKPDEMLQIRVRWLTKNGTYPNEENNELCVGRGKGALHALRVVSLMPRGGVDAEADGSGRLLVGHLSPHWSLSLEFSQTNNHMEGRRDEVEFW